MKNKSFSRRMFVKRSAFSAAGVALAANGFASVYPVILMKYEKPVYRSVRPTSLETKVIWKTL